MGCCMYMYFYYFLVFGTYMLHKVVAFGMVELTIQHLNKPDGCVQILVKIVVV